MQPLSVLLAMRQVLVLGWGQNAFAQRADGSPTSCLRATPGEACFCLVGAFYRTVGSFEADELCIAKWLGFESAKAAQAWNDSRFRTKGQVLARLDAAIRRFLGQEVAA